MMHDSPSRRHLLRLTACAPPCHALARLMAAPAPASVQTGIEVGSGALEVAAASFDSTPPLGVPAPTLGEKPVVREIQGPLETRVFAIRQGDLTLGFASTDGSAYDPCRKRLSEALRIPVERTIVGSTHDHATFAAPALNDMSADGFGRKFYTGFESAAASLPQRFERVTVAYGKGIEDTITYNRKGHRADGTTYFMREEDRVKLPADYRGVIDPIASVLRFDGSDRVPRLLLTHFTGHPVISYQLEHPVINPDYCGWAMIDLVQAFLPARPVAAFFQGCAGDVNSKHMFGGAELAREAGRKLGKAYITASRNAKQIANPVLTHGQAVAHLPYGPLPPLEVLEKELRELLDFQKRVDAGDPNTLNVIGYNFSETMKMGYRRNMAEPLLRWTRWAIQMQKQGRSMPEESYPIPIQAVGFGEAAFVAMPAELFVRIGLRIREGSPYALTIPAAYCNAAYPNYIGTSEDVGDREYMSAFFRHAMKPPYRKPAGDVIADAVLALLQQMMEAQRLRQGTSRR